MMMMPSPFYSWVESKFVADAAIIVAAVIVDVDVSPSQLSLLCAALVSHGMRVISESLELRAIESLFVCVVVFLSGLVVAR